MSIVLPAGMPSLGMVILAGGLKCVPAGWTVHAGGMKIVPLGGAIGTLSRCTWLIVMHSVWEPFRAVTEFAKTVRFSPGTPCIATVTS